MFAEKSTQTVMTRSRIKPPKEGRPEILILKAENEEEQNTLHSIYQELLANISRKTQVPIVPIPLPGKKGKKCGNLL
jgi:hypothetical protein